MNDSTQYTSGADVISLEHCSVLYNISETKIRELSQREDCDFAVINDGIMIINRSKFADYLTRLYIR